MKNKLIIILSIVLSVILLSGCTGINYTETTYIHSTLLDKTKEIRSENPISYNYSFIFNIDDEDIDVHVFDTQYKKYNIGDEVNLRVICYRDENNIVNRTHYEVVD